MQFHLLLVATAMLTAAATINGTVKIDSTPKQTITSFGASGAWWPNDLVHFPPHVQSNLSHFLFSEEGLHLSSYRYNMGGDGGHDEQEVTTNGSRVESFLLRNGTYDWSRDRAGVSFLQAAKQYAVPFITYFVNAAPSHIADNGAACGWNLTSAKVSDFADYVTTVLSYWTNEGLDIKYISPMNEPDNNRADCGQEGMAIAPSLRKLVIKTLRSSLDKSAAKDVSIIADETSQITTQSFPEDPVWLPESAQSISNIAVHNYDYPNDAALGKYYQSILNLSDGHFPPVKFTETCCSTRSGSGSDVFGAQYDPTMTNALIVARYIWQFLTIVQAQSFDWWTAVTTLPCSPTVHGEQCARAINETGGYNSGLVYIDPDYNRTKDYELYYTKRAFMLKHFAYFHRPGSIRYDVQARFPDGVTAFATKSTASRTSSYWTPSYGGQRVAQQVMNALFMNNNTESVGINVQAPMERAKIVNFVQTTDQEDWTSVSPLPALRNGNAKFDLPARSLVTLQFSA